ncbi:minor capsid protein [uncultured Lactobacillus sp.]|uniref:minor capsid protein n=1 Tax=uncultured Lactobacillus sp. TaxID=153152 RepID=UPI00261D4948|nr:minor capsid protein [uncultured Lactobacillus sp.]
MNSQEYWRRRVLYAKQQELDSAADYEDAMRSRLKDLQNEISKEANVFVSRYAETNEISKEAATKILSSIDSAKWSMTLEEFKAKAKTGGYEKELDSEYFKSRIARLQSLHDQLADFASKYADSETDRMAVALAKRYNDTYLLENYNKYLVVGGLDIDLAHFNEQQLKDIVYQPWQGSNFSKRIWKNYTKVMPDVLTDVLLRSTLMGYSWQRTQRMLEDRFVGIENKNLHRLIITEMGHAAEQATAKFYEDSRIDQYQYLATLESHTCDVCAHLDERIFSVKDKVIGLNYPLIHPYCRCTTCAYMKDLPNITSRWSRDSSTGKGKWVKDQPYSQWARKNGQRPYSFDEWKKLEGIKPLSTLLLKTNEISSELGRSRYSKHLLTDAYHKGNNDVDLTYISSDEYKEKFNKLSNNKKLNSQLYKYAKAILTNRDATDHEDSYIFDKTGTMVDQTISKKDEYLQVSVPDEVLKKIHDNYAPWTLVGLHNHPTNIGPSGSDYAVANSRRYDFGVIVTHDGEVYKYSFKNENHVLSYAIDKTIDNIRKSHYNWDEDEIIKETMKKLKGMGLKCEKMK